MKDIIIATTLEGIKVEYGTEEAKRFREDHGLDLETEIAALIRDNK